jgi:hypothetical protein
MSFRDVVVVVVVVVANETASKPKMPCALAMRPIGKIWELIKEIRMTIITSQNNEAVLVVLLKPV